MVYFNVEVVTNERMYASNAFPIGNGLSLQKSNFHLYWERHITSTTGLGLKIELFIFSSGDDAAVNTHGRQLLVHSNQFHKCYQTANNADPLSLKPPFIILEKFNF